MDKELTKKIEWVKEKLRGQEVQDLALFDVKEGQDGEDGAPYYKTYLDQTTASMGALFKKTEWGKLTPWEKLCCYKISGSAGVDCDAALRSTVIYQLAFGLGEPMPYDKKGHYRLKGDGFILRGDTMNSYATTVREFLRTYGHEEDCVKEFLEKVGKKWRTSKQYGKSGAHWEICVLDHYDYFKTILLEKFENSEKFFELYHTVGNFTPWPDGCNVPRGKGATKDYWDLCLQYIYQWYQDNPAHVGPDTLNHDALEKLVGQHKDALGNWLSTFDSWDEFVEKNYMQDFVNQAVGGGYGEPKELWTGHFTKGVMPKTKTDFEQFFTNASAWITARGLRIALAVKAAPTAEGQGAAAGEARS